MSRKDAEIRISENVIFVDPNKLPDDDGRSEYTVYIPDDLTDHFEPSQPVTLEQDDLFDRTGKEPYPGYADELAEWEYRWDEVNKAQARKDEYVIRHDSSDEGTSTDLTPGEVRYLKARKELGHLMRDAIFSIDEDSEMISQETWNKIAAFIQASKTDPRVRRMMLGSIYDLRLEPEDANLLWQDVHDLQQTPDHWLHLLWERGAEGDSHGWDFKGNLLPMPEPPEVVVDWDWPESRSDAPTSPAERPLPSHAAKRS